MKGDEKEQMGVLRGAEHDPALRFAHSGREGGDFHCHGLLQKGKLGYDKPNGYYPYISGKFQGYNPSINLIGGHPGPSETCSSPL
eukprot:407523-Rhodomonas_salina.1